MSNFVLILVMAFLCCVNQLSLISTVIIFPSSEKRNDGGIAILQTLVVIKVAADGLEAS